MSIKDYKIGDELFRYVEMAGVFRYVVTGRREYQQEVQLEVECKTCSHGWQCQLLLAQSDYGKVVAVHMLNEDEDEPQRSWHGNEGFHFWPTVEQCKAEGLQKALVNRKEAVRIAQERLDSAKKSLAEIQALMDGVQP